MALSNWDTLAIDHTSSPVEGSFAASSGELSVDIYKNWIYIRSEEMWHEGSGFSCPTVMEIQEGVFRFGRVNALVVRGPSEGVYLCAWETTYVKDMPPMTRLMAGMGIYGYRGGEWVGVTEEHVTFLKQLIESKVAEHELPQDFLSLDWTAARRFNQGDAFFAGEFGVETPDAVAGDPGTPLFNDALEGLKIRLDDPEDPIHEQLKPLKDLLAGEDELESPPD